MEMPLPIISSNPNIQAFYERLRFEGQSHNMADVLAHRQPPASKYTNTEKAFMQNFENDPLPFVPENQKGAIIEAVSQQTGVNVRGKVYCSKLADTRGPLDPEAWVGSVDDVKRVATKRNLTVTGCVEVQGTPVKTPDIPLAEDRVQHYMREELKKKPNADKRALREKILDEHAPKWSDQ